MFIHLSQFLVDACQEEKPIIYPHIMSSGISTLPTVCQWLKTALIGKQIMLIALNDRNKLYVNGHLAASNCTSFASDENFLIFTTLLQTLRFVHLHEFMDQSKLKAVYARTKVHVMRT
jgi:hypothetical protein